MSISCPATLLVSRWTVPHIWGHRGLPSGPKNEPKYTLTNQIGLCPCSNSIVRGHSSLESPRECLYHDRHPCRYLGGRYHTFWAWGPPSGPKNEPKYAQTNQICLCPSSISIVRDHPSLKSPRECLYHVGLPCWCLGGPNHTFEDIGAPLRPKNRAQICPN